jgi:hypothetical protein
VHTQKKKRKKEGEGKRREAKRVFLLAPESFFVLLFLWAARREALLASAAAVGPLLLLAFPPLWYNPSCETRLGLLSANACSFFWLIPAALFPGLCVLRAAGPLESVED